jgi:hypothetical protein
MSSVTDDFRTAHATQATTAARSRYSVARITTSCVAVIVAAVVLSMRTGGHGAWDTLWAEDARNFVSDAFDRPLWSSVVRPLNGYLVVIPRLLAEPVTVFAPERAAAIVAVEVGIVSGLLAILVFLASGAHLRSLPTRLLVAVPLIMAPVGQGGTAPEIAGSVIGNLATLQFPLTFTVFWMLLWTPATRLARIVTTATVAFTALTTVLTIVYLPMVGARLFSRRDRHSAAMLAALVIGAAIQLTAIVTGYAQRGVGRIRLDAGWVCLEYVRWLVPNAVLGENWWNAAPDAGRIRLAVAAWVVVALVVVLAFAGATRPVWRVAALAAGYSVVLTAVELVTFGAAADRYTFVPGLLLVAAVAALLEPRIAPRRWSSARVSGHVPVVLFVCLMLAIDVVNFRAPNERAIALSWSTGVKAARQECRHGHGGSARVLTHPSRHWSATIVCAKLR